MAFMFLLILTAILVYIYILYPCLLFIVTHLFPRRSDVDDTREPSVALVISARNEESVIEAKIRNSLDLDYPREKLHIYVVSDCSEDRTDDIVSEYRHKGVTLVRMPERQGKTSGLNRVMSEVDDEIVIFSDANAMYNRLAVRHLVRHFADVAVGYVVGHARYTESTDSAADNSESTYWEMEVMLKKWESSFSSVVGGDGAIYAIRRELFEPLQESDINDFVNPLQIVAKGYRGVFDPEAWCSERPAGEFGKEFSRKVRIANRSFNGLLRVPGACNPFKTGRFAWQLVSHKLLRWFSPYFIAGHFALAFIAASRPDNGCLAPVFLTLYGIAAILALVGWWQEGAGRQRAVFFIPYYFMLMNLAAAIGIFKRLKGEVITTWETVRNGASLVERGGYLMPLLLACMVMVCTGKLIDWFGYGPHLLHGLALVLLLVLIYTFIGYPYTAAVLACLYPVRAESDEFFLPPVTLLIAAFNEEKFIESKLQNSLELDYPAELLNIVVVSDGSKDATNELVGKYRDRVELIAFPDNRGKIAALNDAMEQIESKVVVLSDANVIYERHALRKLVRHFSDPRVGAVSGKVMLVNSNVSYGKAENRYYHFEHFIQEQEGKTGAVIGADGAMYAIRRALFTPPPNDTILDDFVISMNIARRGYLVLHEDEAIGYEKNLNEISSEFRRKVRIIAGGIQCLMRGEGVPYRRQRLLLFKFISHKVLRWFSGFLSIALVMILLRITWFDGTAFEHALLFGFAGAVLVAFLGQWVPLTRRFLPVGLIHYLFMLKLATLEGCYLGFTGRQKVTWRQGET